MTPAARVQAAIEVLDQILAGKAAEQALTGWARRSRFAGSKDRAAVRDHVFDALRRLRSDSALGGALTGRGLMIGATRRSGFDPDVVFCGVGHAPTPLSEIEKQAGHTPVSEAEALDIPDWLWPRFKSSLGEKAVVVAQALQDRAPVHLRVNLAKTSIAEAQTALLSEGIATVPHPAAAAALEISAGARGVGRSNAYLAGLVELQDAASQAVVENLPLQDGMRVLDYCAGGGGKALAMAARADVTVFAHDIAPARMKDLPDRALRAGAQVQPLRTNELSKQGRFDLVLCDAPCSGSGAWRRSPEGKWSLTEARLSELCGIQADILDSAARLVTCNGVLAYATCSLLDDENQAQTHGFVSRHEDWRITAQQHWPLRNGTDGFFAAHLTRD